MLDQLTSTERSTTAYRIPRGRTINYRIQRSAHGEESHLLALRYSRIVSQAPRHRLLSSFPCYLGLGTSPSLCPLSFRRAVLWTPAPGYDYRMNITFSEFLGTPTARREGLVVHQSGYARLGSSSSLHITAGTK